jgi:hypothetical protein
MDKALRGRTSSSVLTSYVNRGKTRYPFRLVFVAARKRSSSCGSASRHRALRFTEQRSYPVGVRITLAWSAGCLGRLRLALLCGAVPLCQSQQRAAGRRLLAFSERREVIAVGMAEILANMPDMWRAALADHVPNHDGRCQVCHDASGVSALWPCLMREIAEEAKYIHEGGLPGEFAGRHARR